MLRIIFFVLLNFFSPFCIPNEVSITESEWVGKFFFEEQGEVLIDGSRVYLRYDINIFNGMIANIKLTTWHAPISCDGDYKIVYKENKIFLSYIGKMKDCPYPAPQYEIKKENGRYFIKGAIISYANNKWVKMAKSKQFE
ncbi:hypothetical protein SNQ25_004491 [Cronobacter sakazakii]|uniref:hypothetical protein n=1 Tax=Cronobacter sakazakii TaxID=28141 RepID=UPI000978A63C|nr:hypothetical protein [Cronobacter sakazakii]EGT4352911.1 hypothetical protein [Cronobacter sakazakii]EJH4505634.1 hypothetical protein [Cronobacter sakazakii]ELY2896825.1 hypothetical protein [Cronobacter sakazakii]ELY6264736.1 hypothetical protein [Cronobacter sakazakii]MDK1263237.1 hypothetical protein [Cronobacter sakazakii]